jgi:hypothetical protein
MRETPSPGRRSGAQLHVAITSGRQLNGMDKRALSECDICTKFITPALRQAG